MSKGFSRFRQTKYVFLIGFALLGLGIVLTTTLPDSFTYYVTVTEYKKDFESLKDTEVKLAGNIVPGSIVHDTENAKWNFEVFHEEASLPVFYEGPMPDTFNEDAEVVLTGTYQDNQFVATHVLAKCASRYEERLDAPLTTDQEV